MFVAGIVFLDDVGVARHRDEGVSDAAADDVDLAVDRAAKRVIAAERHRRAALPCVRRRIVHVVGGQHARRPVAVDGRFLRAFNRGCAADEVDLAAHFGGDG